MKECRQGKSYTQNLLNPTNQLDCEKRMPTHVKEIIVPAKGAAPQQFRPNKLQTKFQRISGHACVYTFALLGSDFHESNAVDLASRLEREGGNNPELRRNHIVRQRSPEVFPQTGDELRMIDKTQG